ncbi:hypothetical protein ADL22_26705 [Streptomyces sp. NRRL F-4489]|uniref:hypothetical protein n=1 Tax=Streptomyces sp. NRRL F-4489 TaxID=1609095 RepID=UPI000749947F|nr:hypothetical protein [Streptomyces sp. NRRL F-4489]KUL35617.1 hypothetical protein ADL22_26705 [Streptomyces sp. NRRL F-4489]
MKKIAAGVAVALASAALVVTTQGSAQAAEAKAPAVSAAVATTQGPDNAPQAIGGLGKLAGKVGNALTSAAQKAYVHGKAAAQLAGDAAADLAGNVTDAFGVAPASSVPNGSSVEMVFDK